MKGKFFVLMLVLVFLFASGCAGKDTGPSPEDSNISKPEAGMAAEQKESSTSGSGEDHIVRLEYYKVMRPSELDIMTGDKVSWWSDKKQGDPFVLVSEEKLFPDKELAYSVPYTYTFSSPGTYLFTAKDVAGMNVTVRVK
jgi:plastocyanin